LDIETIDALADAIVNFEGGMVLVSHDFRLISQVRTRTNTSNSYQLITNMSIMIFAFLFQVANEIWVCEKEKVTKWEGGILKYKEHLKDKIVAQKRKEERKLLNKTKS
jgi:ATP-binding cassette subfamily F protein 2